MPEPAYVRWDIVKVPFPYTEGIGEKRRPALVISGKALAHDFHFYWLVMITSAVAPVWKGDVLIKNLAAAGLSAPSVVRTAKVMTVQEDRILGRIGHLASTETKLIQKAFTHWLLK